MTPPTDNIPWDRLVAWLGGGLPPDEERRLEAWAAEDPEREELVTSLRAIWTAAEAGRRTPDVESALAAIKRERDRRLRLEGRPRPQVVPFPRRANVAGWGIAAAAAVILIVGGWLGLRTAQLDTTVPTVSVPVQKTYATSRGQRATFRLPDGTAVILGPESRVRYAPSFGERDRVVELEGEARFEVIHDETRPFAVLASDALIRDLGTDFVVRSRPDEPVVVAVAEGIVAMRGREAGAGAEAPDSVVLHAGDVGRMTSAAEVAVRRGVALDRYFAWTQGRLVFDNMPLADVVAELARWYDVEIQLQGSSLADRRLTAAFDDEPVDQVLSSVAASFDLRFDRSDRRYILSAR